MTAFFQHPAFASRLILERTSLVFLQLSLCMSLCEAQVEVHGECNEPPLAFRADIRSPDAWEMAWESRWPETSSALKAWRNEQFELLVQMWKQAAPVMPSLKRKVVEAAMPESAVYLIWWSTFRNPFDPSSRSRSLEGLGVELPRLQAEEAMAWAHAKSGTHLPLDDWASAMRTGMRLIENFDLPKVHIVQEGETVYSIARTWDISPRCLSAKNGVWDDIQPGMTLLIPNLSN